MGMTNPVIFFNRRYKSSEEVELYSECVFFHGESVDERGDAVNTENKNISQRILVNYDFENMQICLNGKVVDADNATNLIGPFLSEKKIVIEATTLGFAEMFFVIKALTELKISEYIVLYVEPAEYNREKKGSDRFAISEINSGYRSIPKSIIDLASDDVTAGVFFLGYEAQRLETALEEFQMLSNKDIKVAFGIPAFQPGWELNSIVPHLNVIENWEYSYCAANDPDLAYDVLETTRSSLGNNKKMFVAPIGTKPCGIAAAIFASLYPEQVGLLYDHRTKKIKRSKGLNVWHRYSIKFINFNSYIA